MFRIIKGILYIYTSQSHNYSNNLFCVSKIFVLVLISYSYSYLLYFVK